MTWFRGAGQKTMGVALVHEKHPHPRGWNSRVSDKLSSYLPYLFLSFPLLFFFPFPFSFSSAQFLQKVNPSLFLSRAAIYVSEASLCLFAWKRESMVIIFLYLRFSRLFSDGTRCWKFISKDRSGFENIEKG